MTTTSIKQHIPVLTLLVGLLCLVPSSAMACSIFPPGPLPVSMKLTLLSGMLMMCSVGAITVYFIYRGLLLLSPITAVSKYLALTIVFSLFGLLASLSYFDHFDSEHYNQRLQDAHRAHLE